MSSRRTSAFSLGAVKGRSGSLRVGRAVRRLLAVLRPRRRGQTRPRRFRKGTREEAGVEVAKAGGCRHTVEDTKGIAFQGERLWGHSASKVGSEPRSRSLTSGRPLLPGEGPPGGRRGQRGTWGTVGAHGSGPSGVGAAPQPWCC